MISLNTKIHKIINVYNNFSFGLGDYLRGCLFLSQLCIHQQKIFLMNYSQHPISDFLTGGDKENISFPLLEFPFPIKSRYEYLQRLSFLNQYSQENIYMKDNSFPLKQINKNVIYQVLQQIQPTDILINSITNYLNELHLEKNNFIIIHLRIGDDILLDNKHISLFIIKKIIHILKQIINPNKKYLLIGDNTQIKYIIHKYFPFVYFKNSKITHLGMSNIKEKEAILDTLTEFFLMSHCQKIISFSSYSHRTSFGEVASILFNKPFQYFSLLKKQLSITY
jgi:hypothetical protein